jgi:SAM-dependent methyltransferase
MCAKQASPDGKYILIDGNHRAAVALKLGLPMYAKVLKPAEHLRNVSLVKGEFYGSDRLSMPYQSIFYGKKELVRGRRSDIYERISKIAPKDLQGQSVIDLGCNLGANCYTAVHFGARSGVGVDYSPKLISAAIRMNAYFTAPCSFFVQDLNEELTSVEAADTVFCFSITRHLKNLTALVRTLRAKTQKVLYFEGHSDSKLENYPEILNRENFSNIELIGHNRDSIDRPYNSRPFFRCEV